MQKSTEIEYKITEVMAILNLSEQEIYDIFGGKDFIKKNKMNLRYKFDAPEGIVIKYSNSGEGNDLISIVYIFCKNKYEVFIDGFYLNNQSQGKGILSKSLKELTAISKKLGIKIITTKCSRENKDIGYYVLPKLGFNGLHKSNRIKLLGKTKDIKNINSVKDFYKTKAGEALRKEKGRTFDAEISIRKTN